MKRHVGKRHREACDNVISHRQAGECMARGERGLCIRCLNLHRQMGTAKARPPEGPGRHLGSEDVCVTQWAKEQSEKTKTGTISPMGASYRVPDTVKALFVTVRFDPFDLTRVYIEEEAQLRLAPVLGAPPRAADILGYLEPRSQPRP